MPLNPSPSLSASPWPGPTPYTEAQRGLFYGRTAEVDALAQRLQRSRLTVLTGPSGVGKTSLLQAGLTPRLRELGLLPVAVRIDWAAEAASPVEQVKRALLRAGADHGGWTQAGVAQPDESLWEFLHHRDDPLPDGRGQPLLPVLLFDQFEDLLDQTSGDAVQRQRALDFVQELADLAENRVPEPLRLHIEHDATVVAQFDFERSDHRVLLCLDEARLTSLQALRRQWPGLGDTPLRLQPLSRAQALAVVHGPAAGSVDEQTAARIVAHATGAGPDEVPALGLNLRLQRLHQARTEAQRSSLSADDLGPPGADELEACYQRALARHPAGVGQVIEDELLGPGGGRVSLPMEQLMRQLQACGGSPQVLTALAADGLLRVDERHDRLHVELGHELLCACVRRHRDARQQAAAHVAREQALAEERSQAATRLQTLQTGLSERARQLRTARLLGALALGLAVLSLGWTLLKQSSGQGTEQTHEAADRHRGQAEALLAALLDQSSSTLQPLGELAQTDLLGERVLGYFRELPAGLRGADTARSQALAQAVVAQAWASRGRPKQALALADEAEALLRPLQAGGDHSEPVAVALGKLHIARSQALAELQQAEPAKAAAMAGVTALREQLGRSPSSDRLRFELAGLLVGLGQRLQSARDYAGAVKPLSEARALLGQLGGGPSGNTPRAAAALAEASAWLARCHRQLGDLAAMREAAALTRERAAWVLALRPTHSQALNALGVALGELATAELGDHQVQAALALREEQAAAFDRLLALDPENAALRAQAGAQAGRWAAAQVAAGRLAAATRVLQGSRARLSHFAEAPGAAWSLSGNLVQLGELLRDQADGAALDEVVQAHEGVVAALIKQSPPSDITQATLACRQVVLASDARLAAGQPEAVEGLLQAPLARLRLLKGLSTLEITRQLDCMRLAALRLAAAQGALGQATAISVPLGETIFSLRSWPDAGREEQEQLGEMLAWQAWSLVRQGKSAEAQGALAPALEQFRAIQQRAPQSQRAAATLAAMWVVQAQIEPVRRAVHLAQARALWASLSPETQATPAVKQWRDWAEGGR